MANFMTKISKVQNHMLRQDSKAGLNIFGPGVCTPSNCPSWSVGRTCEYNRCHFCNYITPRDKGWKDFASGFKVSLSWFWGHQKGDYLGWAWPNQGHPLKDDLEVRASKPQTGAILPLLRSQLCRACLWTEAAFWNWDPQSCSNESSVLTTTWMSGEEGCEPLREIPSRLMRPSTKDRTAVSLDSQPTETVRSYTAITCSS